MDVLLRVSATTGTSGGIGHQGVSDSSSATSSMGHSPVEVSLVLEDTASCTGLIFGAFSTPRLGTRQVRLRNVVFHAFTFPHAATVQIAVWRRLGDVVKAGYAAPREDDDLSVGVVGQGDSLSPGRKGTTQEGPLTDLYQRRPFDSSAWVYWESFWAPVGEDAATAVHSSRTKAFTPAAPFNALLGLCYKLLDEAPPASARTRASDKSSPSVVLGPLCAAHGTSDRRLGGDGVVGAALELGHRLPQPAPAEEKAEAFSQIYRRGVWPGLMSRSGPGSDPFHPMVRIALSALDAVVDTLGVTSILDAACGDAGWIVSALLSRRPGLSYIGVDIVPHVVEENRERYPTLRFLCMDLGCGPSAASLLYSSTAETGVHEEVLPRVDLVFSKETFNHMIVTDAVHALRRLRATGSRYLLTNITRGAPNYMGFSKGHHANYAQYDYSLPPFGLNKLARVIELNKEDWTEFALFDLQ